MKNMYVYILTNLNHTTFYVGVTNNLIRRIYEHKNNLKNCAFTARYNLHKLVYYEHHRDEAEAIGREKYLKKAYRKQKLKLISALNPQWKDLYEEICK